MPNMVEGIEKIFAFFREIVGRPIRMKDFEDRLILQKLCYILKKTDNSVKYNFNWYIRGPYSPPLAHDAFEYKGPVPTLTQDELKNVKPIKKLLSDNVSDSNLELLASILYLIKERKMSSYAELIHTMKLSKPCFTEEDISNGVKKIKEAGYLN